MTAPPGERVPLKVIHQGNESLIEDDATALIGSDASSTVRIVRPGISRRHAIVTHDGSAWKIQDAGSRNGTFLDGHRIQTTTVDGPTTLYLGHPTDGEALSFVPVAAEPASPPKQDDDEPFDLPASPPTTAAAAATATSRTPPSSPKDRAGPKTSAGGSTQRPATKRTIVQEPVPAGAVSDVELAQLTAAIRDQVSAVKGLTWSVWAMIAVTAALIVLTLFVGILSN